MLNVTEEEFEKWNHNAFRGSNAIYHAFAYTFDGKYELIIKSYCDSTIRVVKVDEKTKREVVLYRGKDIKTALKAYNDQNNKTS